MKPDELIEEAHELLAKAAVYAERAAFLYRLAMSRLYEENSEPYKRE